MSTKNTNKKSAKKHSRKSAVSKKGNAKEITVKKTEKFKVGNPEMYRAHCFHCTWIGFISVTREFAEQDGKWHEDMMARQGLGHHTYVLFEYPPFDSKSKTILSINNKKPKIMRALKLSLSNNDVVTVYFDPSKGCTLSINDSQKINFNFREDKLIVSQQSEVNFKTKAEIGLGLINIEEIDVPANFKKQSENTCIICGAWQYCMSGGCANTPCGWICG